MVSSRMMKRVMSLPMLKLSGLVAAMALLGACAGEEPCANGQNDASCQADAAAVGESTDQISNSGVSMHATVGSSAVLIRFVGDRAGHAATPAGFAFPQGPADLVAPQTEKSDKGEAGGDREDPEPDPWSPPTHDHTNDS